MEAPKTSHRLSALEQFGLVPRERVTSQIDLSNHAVNQAVIKGIESFKIPRTGFSFLDDHYGLRPGMVHMLAAGTGVGKSTLVRSLVANILATGTRILFLSTEEYQEELHYNFVKANIMPDHMKDFFFVHESQLLEDVRDRPTQADLLYYFDQIKLAIGESFPKVFIIDNITASPLYKEITLTNKFMLVLKRIAKEFGIAILAVSHLKDGIRSTTLDSDAQDMKGGKDAGIRAEYFYTYRLLKMPDGNFESYVEVTKARFSQPFAIYRLTYSGTARTFIHDKSVTRGELQDAIKRSSGKTSKGS